MADVSDVRNAIAAIISQTLYPNGTGSASLTGDTFKVNCGWPVAAQLDRDVSTTTNGAPTPIVNVSVIAVQGTEQNTSRFPTDRQTLSTSVTSVTLTKPSAGQLVVGGTPAVGQTCVVVYNNVGYTYPVQAADTLTAIATGLAATMAAIGATNSGPVITMPAGGDLAFRVVGNATAVQELQRFKRLVQVTFWCGLPLQRDRAVPPVIKALVNIEFLVMPDGSLCRLILERDPEIDTAEKVIIYRRDLIFTVEYAVTNTETDPVVGTIKTITHNLFDPSAPITTNYV